MSGPKAFAHTVVASTRRSWVAWEKRAIVDEARRTTSSISSVARRHGVSIRSGPPCRAWVRVRSIRVCWIDLDRAHVWTQSFGAYGGGQYAPVLGGLGEARHCRRGAADHEFDLFGGAPARDHPEPSVSVAARTSAAGAVRRTPARSGLCPACAAFSR